MARPTLKARNLARDNGRVRPSLDLTGAELLLLRSLPFPKNQGRDARVAALLSSRYESEEPPPVTPRDKPVVSHYGIRMPVRLLARLDEERGEHTRGAYFSGILALAEDTSRHLEKRPVAASWLDPVLRDRAERRLERRGRAANRLAEKTAKAA